MADGFALLGNALGGNSEKSYQEGLALGANTQNALAQARARVDENQAKAGLADVLSSIPGISPEQAAAASTTLRAGGGLGDAIKLALGTQEYGFRATAGDPTKTADERNIALQGVANAPVEQFYKVGGGYGNKFDSAAGITPLGDALGTDGGGQSAALQLIHEIESREQARRKDPNFRLSPRQAIMIARETQRLTDSGGVPGVTNLADALGLSGDMPPAPQITPVQAPGPAATAPQTPAAPIAPAITPLTTAAQVGANAAEIKRAETVGKGIGEAQLNLPQAKQRFLSQTQQTDAVMAKIDKALPEVSAWTTGVGGKILGNLWGTPAYDLQSAINTIKANIGFGQLQQMRYDSPTGGALGQVAVQELQFLQAALGNLDTAQSPGAVRDALAEVRRRYDSFKAAAARDYAAAEQMAAGNVGGAPIPGVGAPGAATPAGADFSNLWNGG